MIRFLVLCFLVAFFSAATRSNLRAQSQSLFDDKKLSSVYIEMDPDSVIWLYQNVLSTKYLKADFIFRDGQFSDTVRNVGFRLRGNTSRYAQKKSFKVSFNTFVSGRKYQGVKKLNFNGQHNDPTMIREKLFYNIWNRCKMPERRTTFIRLYVNGAYFGLYTCLEEMDKDWLTRNYSNNSGNLYKCTYPADLQYLGLNQATYKNISSGSATGGRAYDLETNESQDDYSSLVQLVAGLNSASGPQMANQLNQVANVDLFLKALAIDVSTGNWDNYAYNKNNYYLYFNPATQRMDFISYDTDNTFGVDWIGINWATRLATNWINPDQPRPLASRLLEVPAFKQRYYQFLDSISRFVIHPTVIFPHIDSLKTLIASAVLEDTYRTLDYGYSIADFNLGFTGPVDGHTPFGIKPFLDQRSASSIAQVAPLLSAGFKKSNPKPRFFPNPAKNEIFYVGPDISQLKILDSQGRVVAGDNLNLKFGEINLNGLLPGLYFFQYSGVETRGVAKILIE